MSNMVVIKETEVLGRMFKVYGTVEEPLFLAKDVAEVIEYSKTSEGYYNVSMMLRSIDDDEKITINIVDSETNRARNQWFLTENGLYEVLMQSRKPIAKAFKKEVKKILKALRLNQVELVNTTNETKIDTFIIDTMNSLINSKDKTISLLEEKIDFLERENLKQNDISIKENNKTIIPNTEDKLENKIMKNKKEIFTIDDIVTFLNDNCDLPKEIGRMYIYDMLRKHNIFMGDIPMSLTDGYFIREKEFIDRGNYINKYTKLGFILIYRIVMEDFTLDYTIDRLK